MRWERIPWSEVWRRAGHQCVNAAWILILSALLTLATLHQGLRGGEETAPAGVPAPVAGGPALAPAEEEEHLVLSDPEGDDCGPGTYVYPRHLAFTNHRGLFDLLLFRVASDGEEVHFDLTFKELTNPWRAPEGFFHQRVDIYIDTTPRVGRTDTLREGAYVRFTPRYAWDVLVRGAPWGGSAVFFADGRKEKAEATVLAPRTIRISIPQKVLGKPQRRWNYYVLVGAYDGFGPDNYRLVMGAPGDWVFGGGADGLWDPNVIDLLAPRSGRWSQRSQLGSYDVEAGRLAVLYPVGFETGRGGGLAWYLALAVLGVALAWWALRHNWLRPAE